MLDLLLECGRHLPVLTLVLSWVSPVAWVRLRCAKLAFNKALGDEQLRALATTSARLPDVDLDVFIRGGVVFSPEEEHDNDSDDDLEREDDLEVFEDGYIGHPIGLPGHSSNKGCRWHKTADAAEIAYCESAFLALLHGSNLHVVEPATCMSTLMRAAEMGYRRLCRLLVANGADCNVESVGGATALSLAISSGVVCRRQCRGGHIQAAQLLLRHTSKGLPQALVSATRMAMQDDSYLPLLAALVTSGGALIHIDAEVVGPDGRHGTALSAALERRVKPVESPLIHRPRVVATLLSLRADPGRSGPYTAWWGGAPTMGLMTFAAVNGCDLATLELLRADGEIKGIV